jgi:formate--tetrahydrofolate ligase
VKKIFDLASELGLSEEDILPYGWYIGKVNWKVLNKLKDKEKGKLILVSAMNPTPLGEGKTTTTIGLGDALNLLSYKTIICIREPSMGPFFGVKGGAIGGGKSKVIPEENINLHFTGDIHAVTSANNLLSAMLDNHIYQGNELEIDINQIFWKRCIDMNDRQLRFIVSGLGGKGNGIPREDGFDITAASEVMAILSLSRDIQELKDRLGNIIVGINKKGNPVFSRDLEAHKSMAVLLKDALSPNLVQTLEGTPAFVHGGPFANIAHGCNSLISTDMALRLADFVVTEAGFGADLGAEKFFNIKCRIGNLKPNVVILVATIRALKYHGGVKKDWEKENIDALEKGLPNLFHHIYIIKEIFGLPVVVAINIFSTDTEKEINFVMNTLKEKGVRVAISEVYEKGGKGGVELAKEILSAIENDPNNFTFLYDLDEPYEEKIRKIAVKVYGAKDVIFSEEAKEDLKKIEKWGFKNLPICMAKTQFSLSDNPKLIGKPENFVINVQRIKISGGAGFLVAYTGNIMTMPGLPKIPSACKIDINDNGDIMGVI